MKQTRSFEGYLNLDDLLERVPEKDYRYLLNGVKSKSYDGKRGSIESIFGTSAALTPVSAVDGNSTCIGGIRDIKDSAWYLFFHNTTAANNCIVKLKDNVLTNVLTSAVLNFSTSYLINGGGVAGGVLYWTDNINPPRAVSTTKYVSSSSGISADDILLIKRGGQFPMTAVKSYDSGTDVDRIKDYGFQFTYQYMYENNQLSVVAPYSELVPQNTSEENFNKITATIPLTELIPSLVKEVIFYVRVGNTGTYYSIGSVKIREVYSAASTYQINDVVLYNGNLYYAKTVNSAVTPTVGANWGYKNTIDFYNNTNGLLLESDYLNAFHSVPITAKTMELLKGRLWLANYIEGYDTPTTNFLTQEVNTLTYDIGVLKRELIQLYRVNYRNWLGGGSYTDAFLKDNELGDLPNNPADDLIIAIGPTPPAYPDIMDAYRMHYNSTDGYWYIVNNDYDLNGTLTGSDESTYFGPAFTPIVDAIAMAEVNPVSEADLGVYEGAKTFPQYSSYKLGLVFKDDNGRSSGVQTSDANRFDTPKDRFSRVQVDWALPSGINTDIPVWAKYVSIVMTRNLSKSWYFEHRTVRIKYYKDASLSTTYSADNDGIKIDITPIIKNGQGYTFTEGDRIVIDGPDGTNRYDLAIKSFDGEYILCDNINIGSITDEKIYFEVYRPIPTNTSDLLFYEIGQVFEITNWGTSSREFGTTSGTIYGDSIIKLKKNYKETSGTYAEETDPDFLSSLYKSMSLDFDGAWDTDIGKPYSESRVGQTNKSTYFRHSSPFIADTEINGLCEFYAGDESTVSIESGEINRLKSTTRVATDGDVMLAISRNETSSIYIGEARMQTNDNQSFILQTTGVIGEVRTLKGNWGTVHPESVFDINGNVFWYDKIRRSFLRYSTNGIYPISNMNCSDYFEDLSQVSQSRVVTGYHPFYGILFATFSSANGSYTDKTIGFDNTSEQGGWLGFFSFSPSFYMDIEGDMYSIVGGSVYRHNSTTFNSFYGVDYDTIVKVVLNDNPLGVNEWTAVALKVSSNFMSWANSEQSIPSGALSVTLDNEYGQETDILYDEFDIDENKLYADFKKDSNSPGGLLAGDDMVSEVATLGVTFSGGSHRYLKSIEVGFNQSKGHNL